MSGTSDKVNSELQAFRDEWKNELGRKTGVSEPPLQKVDQTVRLVFFKEVYVYLYLAWAPGQNKH